jgi:hypothetical protein
LPTTPIWTCEAISTYKPQAVNVPLNACFSKTASIPGPSWTNPATDLAFDTSQQLAEVTSPLLLTGMETGVGKIRKTREGSFKN